MVPNDATLVAEVLRDLNDDAAGGMTIWRDGAGRYHVEEDGFCVQPNHDAEAVIRYLAHVLQNHWGKKPGAELSADERPEAR